MYAQVVVLTYQSPNIDSYTYEIPKNSEKEIQVGQLVEVPFGKRSPQGIVIGTSNQLPVTSYQIKPINKILFPTPILIPFQIQLLKWMSEYYMAPMVNCFEAAMPPLNAKSLKPNATLSINQPFDFSQGKLALSTQQTLILVPTINQIPETLAKFPRAKNYVVYHNELKLSEKFAAWQKILSGKADYMFGSSSAIFSPCPNLNEIIIYDEHDGAYKDEHSPYFDTLTVAQKICQLTKAQIKIADSSPKITTYFQLKNHIKMQKFGVKTKVVSLTEEKLTGNFSPISSYLQNELRKKQSIILFLNKKKESGSMYCKNCKFNDYFEKHPEFCPKCKSQDLYFNVLNVETLSAEVKKFTKNPNIDIQTATVFYAPKIKQYDLAAYIQSDSLINRADFVSVETLYSQITNLKKLLKENGQLIIQTYNPNDETINAIASGNYESFLKTQIEYRRLLKYPPHALLIKLSIKGKDREKVEKLAHGLFANLTSAIEQFNNSTISLLGPFEPMFFPKIPKLNIIIKYKLGSYSLEEREKAIKKIAPLLKKIEGKIQITVEPVSLN